MRSAYHVSKTSIGLTPLQKTQEGKRIVHMIISFIIMVAVEVIISAFLMAIFGGMIGYGIGYSHFGM
ncbi:MAG: hypothetical protein ABI237_04865 [Ginsengibacter sp.]